MVGLTLNNFVVESKIGSGGMGDVYRARDTKLVREVAIKVISKELTRDPERLQRFQREARLMASLNHPNIATVYGLEEARGESFLVMELVPGRTAREVIAGKRMNVRHAVDVGRQIAAALEAAHARGILHRDLKPANIKITPDGVVKVLDFGLAKSFDAQAGQSSAPTAEWTTEGVVMGTAGYMSPEQAQGVEVDRRTDLWAFGCVLFELLTGRPAFGGTSVAQRVAAGLTQEPDWNMLPSDAPAALKKLLRRCLAKDRKARYQDAGDVRLELEEALDSDAPARAPKSRYFQVVTSVVVASAIAALVSLAYEIRRNNPQGDAWSSELLNVAYEAVGPRISPDGQTLAFQAFKDGLNQVAVFKPSAGDLTVQLLTKERTSGIINDISWSDDGTRLYYDRYARTFKGIYSVPLLGGEPRLVLENAKAPKLIADGSLLVTRINEKRQNQLYRFWPQTRRVQALNALLPRTSDVWSPPVRVFSDGKEAVFYGRPLESPDSSNELHAIDLDANRVRRLAPAISIRPTTEYFALSVDPAGRYVLVDQPDGDFHRLVEVPRDGGNNVRTLLTVTMAPWFLDVARDGSIYVDQVHRPSQLLRYPVSGGEPEQLGVAPGFVAYGHGGAISLPDGRVLMASIQGGRNRLLITAPGGLLPFVETSEETSTPAALLGEREVALVEGSGLKRRIAVASLPDDRIVRWLSAPPGDLTSMVASPDGSTLYCVVSGSVWALPSREGASTPPKKLLDADGVAVDPRNGDLIVQIFGAEGVRLVRVPPQGGAEREISFRDDTFVMWPIPLSPNAVGSDGRILVQGGRTDTWSYRVGAIDPASQSVSVVPLQFDGDLIVPGWTRDGKIVSIGFRYRMNLWRFRPTVP